MHVVVVGCGRVGSELAAALTGGGHSVAVVDRNPDAFRRLPENFSGRTIQGVGFDRARLVEAGVEEAGAVAAVTNGDNSNILVARVARENFGVERVVARIYDPRRAAIYERLGIPTVATVAWTTQQALQRMFPEEGGTVWTDGNVQLVELALPAALAGKPLADLEEPGRWRLAAVNRLGASQVASPDLVGQEGDILFFSLAAGARGDLDDRLGLAAP